jgi:prepilin-type N-terminal cleavage/methylation domain-containing protein
MNRLWASRSRQTLCATVAPGFTLIELMVAITILGVIFVMLTSSFHAVAATKVGAEQHLATGQQSRDVIWQLSNEIRGTVQTLDTAQPSHVTVLGQGSMANNAPLDSLTIITLDPGHRRAIEGFGPEDTVTYATAPNAAGLSSRGLRPAAC